VSRKHEFKPTRVGKGATLGANSTIVCGTSLGTYAFVGAGSVVTRDIPDYALVFGNPGRVMGWVCRCGEKLAFQADRAECRACGLKYQKSGNRVKPQTSGTKTKKSRK
jgi:UDP-2-acetamido-3-amino-2,3-dideoxy-glucuronate N-acetyltransferase